MENQESWACRCAALLATVVILSMPGFGQTFQGQVNIDGNTVTRASIPSSLYGANLEWVHSCWGAWSSSRNGLVPKAAALTQTMGPTVLRFPGGVFSDFYRWRDGTGTVRLRKASPVTSGPELSTNAFGTDEALRLANSIGAKLLITVNAGTATAEEAAAWVKYVNSRSTLVRDWEIGNELYARSLSADAAKITMSPETYAQKVIEFARAMKAADPKIRIGAIGGENAGVLPLVEYSGWNQIVLQRAGAEIDFLAVHNAYSPVMFCDRGENLETVYSAMLASPAGIAASFKRIAAEIDQYAPASSRSRIQIALTEWGPSFHYSPLSRFVDHQKTLTSALFTASTMMTILEEPRVESAHFFKLFDYSFAGAMGLRNGEWQETSPFYALQLFRRNFGTRLISTQVQAPAFRSEATGILPVREGNPLLQAVSSLSANGSTLYVIVVNKHLTSSGNVAMAIAGLRASGTATVRTLQGTGIDAHTGTQLPSPEKFGWVAQAKASVNPKFDQGMPGQVGIQTRTISGIGSSFNYTFPPASVTALEIPLIR